MRTNESISNSVRLFATCALCCESASSRLSLAIRNRFSCCVSIPAVDFVIVSCVNGV